MRPNKEPPVPTPDDLRLRLRLRRRRWLHPSYSSREPAPPPEHHRPSSSTPPPPQSSPSPNLGARHRRLCPGELGILPVAAGMAAGKARKGAGQASPASGGDRIGALPDEILRHVLSSLPAQQAVQTCVLARRWRHLWKSAPGIRVVGADGKAPVSFEQVREFVDSLLLLRGSSPLETFELRVTGAAIDIRQVRRWVRYAVECKVQILRLSFLGDTTHARLRPEDPPLASRHLTKLEIHGLTFNNDFLDFSKCPMLQDLLIEDCSFESAERILSQSFKASKYQGRHIQPEFPSSNSCPESGFIDATSLCWQDSCA